ncbi:hypothetical protein BGZ49_001906 [Haplosporangium sp. Z 27]|nr:hypothetical protein BGZ49_001906 [Haplosporangium sp. Z 27]
MSYNLYDERQPRNTTFDNTSNLDKDTPLVDPTPHHTGHTSIHANNNGIGSDSEYQEGGASLANPICNPSNAESMVDVTQDPESFSIIATEGHLNIDDISNRGISKGTTSEQNMNADTIKVEASSTALESRTKSLFKDKFLPSYVEITARGVVQDWSTESKDMQSQKEEEERSIEVTVNWKAKSKKHLGTSKRIGPGYSSQEPWCIVPRQ